MHTPSSETSGGQNEYCYRGYSLVVEPGRVELASRYKDTAVFVNDGVRAYDARALSRLQRISGGHAGLARQLLGLHTDDVATRTREYDDDMELLQSDAVADRTLMRFYQLMQRGLCRMLYWQSIEDQFEELAIDALSGGNVMTRAASELDSIIAELNQLADTIPAAKQAVAKTPLINAQRSLTAATVSFRSASTIAGGLADILRRTKGCFSPIEQRPTVEK